MKRSSYTNVRLGTHFGSFIVWLFSIIVVLCRTIFCCGVFGVSFLVFVSSTSACECNRKCKTEVVSRQLYVFAQIHTDVKLFYNNYCVFLPTAAPPPWANRFVCQTAQNTVVVEHSMSSLSMFISINNSLILLSLYISSAWFLMLFHMFNGCTTSCLCVFSCFFFSFSVFFLWFIVVAVSSLLHGCLEIPKRAIRCERLCSKVPREG